MKIAFFSVLPFEQTCFESYCKHHQITYIPEALDIDTVGKAKGHQAVCAFVNDNLSQPVLERLHALNVSIVGLRSAGVDNVDQVTLTRLGMTLLKIPGYSPHAVAEHTVALLLGLIRHLPEASQRVQCGNFAIDGLMGTDLHGKTVGVIGTGRIGRAFAQIMLGFGCTLLAYDIQPSQPLRAAGVQYVSLNELMAQADVVSLHCPLTSQTNALIGPLTLALMKPEAILINTARGRLIDTDAVLNALDKQLLRGYATDVYENEKGYFHHDFSEKDIPDNRLNRLRHHPNVLLTAHQGFLTKETLSQIALGLLNQFTFYENRQTQPTTQTSLH